MALGLGIPGLADRQPATDVVGTLDEEDGGAGRQTAGQGGALQETAAGLDALGHRREPLVAVGIVVGMAVGVRVHGHRILTPVPLA